MYVLVLDKNKQPLMPCHASRARLLLKNRKAAVFRRFPFTIILKEREGGVVQPTRIKVDPGSKTSGVAVVVERKSGETAVFGANIEHRGETVKSNMDGRRGCRRARRNRNTRYSAPRFDNRTRPKGWLPPSILSRVANVETWVKRLFRFTPATEISLEHAKFDTQLMENPDIQGVEY